MGLGSEGEHGPRPVTLATPPNREGASGCGGYHCTFSPLFYSTTIRAEALDALREMAANNYTLVRVFVDSGDGVRNDSVAGIPGVDTLGPAYLDNAADFVGLAAQAGVAVMFTFERLPGNAYFNNVVGAADPVLQGVNAFYLHPGSVKAKALALQLFIQGLRARLSPAVFNNIAVYSIENEAYMESDALPFSSTTLSAVTTADGHTYSMLDAASRQQCADANGVNWANTVFSVIATEHPGAAATVGMFTYQAVNKDGPNGLPPVPSTSDPRYPLRPAVMSQFSTASFLDVHVYPLGSSFSLSSDLASSEWSSVNFTRTPVFMGEFGAFKQFYPDTTSAALALRDLQVASCSQHFQGWLLWTWDTDRPSEQPELWSMVDNNGAINGVLSPAVRKDPCVE